MISSVSSDSQITPAMEKRMIFQVSLSVRETIGTASPGGDSGSEKPFGAGISALAGGTAVSARTICPVPAITVAYL